MQFNKSVISLFRVNATQSLKFKTLRNDGFAGRMLSFSMALVYIWSPHKVYFDRFGGFSIRKLTLIGLAEFSIRKLTDFLRGTSLPDVHEHARAVHRQFYLWKAGHESAVAASK